MNNGLLPELAAMAKDLAIDPGCKLVGMVCRFAGVEVCPVGILSGLSPGGSFLGGISVVNLCQRL